MAVINLPDSTRIYLTRRYSPYFCIQPGTNYANDTFTTLYDVFSATGIIIPAKSLVTGNWSTSTSPISCQLTITSITINNVIYSINGTSSLFYNTTSFESSQIENATSLSLIKTYKSIANISRRLIKVKCQNAILYNEVPDTIFVLVDCGEIVITTLNLSNTPVSLH